MLDHAEGPLDGVDDDRLLAVLKRSEPFPAVPDTDAERLGAARFEIRAAQRQLAIGVVRAGRRPVMAGITGLMQDLVDEDPYDEELAEADARLRATLFGRRHGLEALHQTRLRLLDSGLTPSEGLQQLEASLLGEPTPEDDSEPTDRPRPDVVRLPADLCLLQRWRKA
ncbi:MAG: hypothetical protein AAFO29_27105, partial [Actinomycetota bacterium]